ncbi:ankyrin repeat domain-containing protein SOWAHC isoform X2 [Austrofundulus limnaeus]|uniref:Ankyrin repeat domain-containing protein SOWAHC isoform X2 n=1 Tax=Austrofundulus limnaeus TaxID=52670 RepID=A0A2I4CEP7_AUSLI|nr:PREDICTED: ankyrin repeat domain-containing protein SOWAHC-like isoform X2 [Austrofundulus limnaeus]
MDGVSQQDDPDPNPEGLTQDQSPSAVDPEPRPDPDPTGLTQDQDEPSLLVNSDGEADATDEDHNDPPRDQDQDQVRAEDPTEQSLTQDSDRDSRLDQNQAPSDLMPVPDQSEESGGGGGSALVVTETEESEEDDTRSVTASSVTSLFHRVQLDPLEKDWLRSSALGNMAAQRLLLAQEPSLVLKKDFITTALHWAAKQGHQEVVEMMLRSGADVNIRSNGGYTALHLASIHGHQDVVRTLIASHHAKTNIRDYHGKTAVQYWTGGADVFNRPDSQSDERFCRTRRTQRFGLLSLRLSRSRSQGQLHLEFGTPPQSATYDALDLHI